MSKIESLEDDATKRNIMTLVIFVLMVATLISYYLFGAEAFPDYDGYLLASNPLYEAGSYYTEFLSRFLLHHDLIELGEWSKIDTLAFVVQFIVCALLMHLAIGANKQYPVLVFCALYLPLFLTTTLRAAPLYAIFFYISSMNQGKGLGLCSGLIILVFGSLFHDSAIVIFLIITCSLCFHSVNKKIKMDASWLLVFTGGVIIFLGDSLVKYLMAVVDFSFLGYRAIYLTMDKVSTAKYIYSILMLILVCLANLDKGVSKKERDIIVGLYFCYCLVFMFSSTSAVRVSVFLLASIIASRGVLALKEEGYKDNYILITPFIIGLLMMNFWMLVK